MSSTSSEFLIAGANVYNRRSPEHWLLSHIRRYWIFALAIFICAVLNALGAFVVPPLLGEAFNFFLNHPHSLEVLNLVGNLAVIIIISQIVRCIFQLMRNASAETIGQRLERDIRDELYASLLGKSMTFHSMQAVGDIMARATNDVREINLMMNPGVNTVVGSAMFLVIPLFMAPAINPQLLLTPVLFILSLLLSLRFYSTQLRPATEDVRARFGDMNARLAEALDGIETVKGASQEKLEGQRFYQNAHAVRNAFVRQSNIEARFIPLLLLGIANGTGFLHAIILFKAGLINVGDIITYMGYLQLFGFPTWISLYGFSQLSLGIAASRRIYDLIVTETNLDENRTGHTADIRGQVQFEDVTFSYPNSANPALNHISFTAAPGQIIALVGQTGAGKSSIARLINRTYDTDGGRVLIDGVDVRQWKLESLRSQISIIEQDIFLFSRTIAENIAFGRPGATQAEIEQAARDAQAHDFILSFKDGYQTVIGMRGVTLSGGQRQRIALARAFLANPRILILDDSTSAIDSATEDQIQRAIQKATQGRTTFLITHRLSQIRWADQIIVMRKGVAVASGTHEELLSQSEAYRRIFVGYEAPAAALERAEGK